MLDSVKKARAKGVFAWFILGAICLVFVFISAPPQLGQGIGGAAATVNDSIISISQFQQAYQRRQELYRSFLGGQGMNAAQRSFLKQGVLQGLIEEELVAQEAEEEGIWATKDEVRDFLTNELSYFKKNGRFDKELYLNLLKSNRMNHQEFEKSLKKDILRNKARQTFEAALSPLSFEVKKELELQKEKVNISFAKLTKTEIAKGITVSSGDKKRAQGDAALKKEAETYYKEHKSEYIDQEEVQAQHILIKADHKDAKASQKALEKINGIKARLGKEDFTKLAKELSEDPGSQKKGGDLGFFKRGRMVPEFEKIAFTLPEGKVSDPVKTNFGYHLIKVTKKKPRKERSLKEVEDQIFEKILATKKAEALMTSVEKSLAGNDRRGLNRTLKKLGVKWEETGFFDLGTESIPKVGINDDFAKSAFLMKKKNQLSKNLVKQGSNYYVLKLKERKVEKTNNLDKVKSDLERDRVQDLYTQWIKTARKSASIETNPKVIQ